MLHKLKPVPRGLLILAIVGGLGYAALSVDLSKVLPKKEVAETSSAAPTVVVVPRAGPVIVNPAQGVAELANANGAVQAAKDAATAAATAAPPSGLTAAPSTNAGLDAVLGAGKK